MAGIFRMSHWSAVVSAVLIAIAVARYPGGTLRDPGTIGYSFSRNFLSDLGMTVTHGGHANALGARVFAVSFGLLAIAIIGSTVAFMRLLSTVPRARGLAVAGGIGVVVAGLGLLGTALAPADVSPFIHRQSAALASAIAPLALLCFAAASARDSRLPRGVAVAWIVLAVTVAIWFSMRWAPGIDTDFGLTLHATVQKAVAIVILSGLVYLTRQVERVLSKINST